MISYNIYVILSGFESLLAILYNRTISSGYQVV
jgi:hypothetical protein